MFTGIIEAKGEVVDVITKETNQTLWIQSPLSKDLKIDQSIAHNGVCLTIEEIHEDRHRVTAVEETLKKTVIGKWQRGEIVNLERSLTLGSRLDGHFVQGHVDATGICQKIKNRQGSYEITFSFPEAFAPLIIEKGSICVDGISLTAFNVSNHSFNVAIIPYTWQHTNLQNLKEGAAVNLEFDLLGKYIVRNMTMKA